MIPPNDYSKLEGSYPQKFEEWKKTAAQLSHIEYNIGRQQEEVNKKTQELRSKQSGWLGSSVNYIAHTPVLNNWLGRVGFINSEELAQNSLEKQISNLKKEIDESIKRKEKLEAEFDDLSADLEGLERRPAIIMNLFGGKEAFEKLPILDIGNREGNTGYIDFITANEMKAPIMRGKDKYQREFFVIKARDETGESYCQAFFQERKGLNWTDGVKHYPIFDTYSYFIEDGKLKGEINMKTYESLKSLIQTGKCQSRNHTFTLDQSKMDEGAEAT